MEQMDFESYRRRLGGHGLLTDRDLIELSAGAQRVFSLMRDGGWHTRDEIELAAGANGVPAEEGLRRMRELRRGFEIERARIDGRRAWKYRIKK